MPTPTLIEKIYEAAFVPQGWNDVLHEACRQSGSASGELLVYDGPQVRHWIATGITRDFLRGFAATPAHQHSPSEAVLLAAASKQPRFRPTEALLNPEELARYTVAQALDELGLGRQIGIVFPLSNAAMLVFSFERRKEQDRHDAASLARLNALRPHLFRAGRQADWLGWERARGALAALTALDLPAALLDRQGRLCEVNALLTPALLDTRGGGRVVLGERAADALLTAALNHSASRPCSIPLPARGTRPARIAHVAALPDAVRDPLASATHLLVLKAVGASRAAGIDRSMLPALFGLSGAESRLAATLAGGIDLAQAAADCGIRVSTARSYLDRIFQKTGCHRQAELVALLAGLAAPPASSREGASAEPA